MANTAMVVWIKVLKVCVSKSHSLTFTGTGTGTGTGIGTCQAGRRPFTVSPHALHLISPQSFAAVLFTMGLLAYPAGWSAPEVRLFFSSHIADC